LPLNVERRLKPLRSPAISAYALNVEAAALSVVPQLRELAT